MPCRAQIGGARGLFLGALLCCVAAPRTCQAQAAPFDHALLRARLVRAFAKGDRAALEREAAALGEGGMLRALRGGGDDRPFILAAIAVASSTRRSFALLPALVAIVSRSKERSVALAACQAAERIARDLQPRALRRHDEPLQALEPTIGELLKIAGDGRRALDLRVGALMVAAQILAQLDLKAPAAIGPLLVDREPAVRRAALEVAAAHPDARRLFRRVVLQDPDPEIRRAAAANYCANLPAKIDARRRVLAHPAFRARLEATGADKSAPRDELVDIARCLRVFAPEHAARVQGTTPGR